MENINIYDSNGELVDLLIQWDKGITLYFNDNIFNNDYTIHLFTDSMKEAMVVETLLDDNGILSVKIPDDLLSLGQTITGYICTRTDIEYRNAYRFKIPVRKKPIPSSYIYTDSEEYVVLEMKMDEIEANVELANTYAVNAKISEQNALQSETNSKISEENAKTSERLVLKSEQNISVIEQNVSTIEQNILISENNTKTSEKNAKTSEMNTKAYADELRELYNTTPPSTDITKEVIDTIMINLE